MQSAIFVAEYMDAQKPTFPSFCLIASCERPGISYRILPLADTSMASGRAWSQDQQGPKWIIRISSYAFLCGIFDFFRVRLSFGL
jgi:hypothetical protein